MKLHLTIDLDQFASRNEYGWTYLNMKQVRDVLGDLFANCPNTTVNRDDLPWSPQPEKLDDHPQVTYKWELELHD